MQSTAQRSLFDFLSLTRAMQLYQLLRLGSVILTSILLAKSSLSVSAIGSYEALLFIGSTAAFFWANGLLQGIPPVYARLEEDTRKAFLFTVFWVFTAIALGLFSLLWLGQGWLVPALTGLPEVPGFGWFCVYLFFNLATLPVEYVYLLQGRPGELTNWGMLSFGLFVLAMALPVYAGFGLMGGLIALAVLGALRFLWMLRLLVQHSSVEWRPDLLRQYLRFSTPLVLNLMVGNLVILFDNWLVGWYYQDEGLFAVFRYGSREFPLAIALATALGTALLARIATEPEAGLAELKTKTRRLFHLLFPLTMFMVWVAKPLFPLVFSPAFADSAGLFQIYLLLTISRVLLPNTIVVAKGRPRIILLVGLVELIFKVVLGFLFIHWWGLVGVAWSAVIAFFIEKIGLIVYLERRLKIPTSEWLDWRWYLGYSLALVVVFFCT
ncbi:MAG: polysaccharide biosynthesis C-terminal domain-containing protein [Lewinellaceae bacterium]|nr:polysaccharide biosynthesis C-terminal domain-containing protein [Saprospiraceae bacterium]MCB9330259.1 polysaccharide biosynthesis C-terminal domain-containing protein [Lewinellaceae bacterium]